MKHVAVIADKPHAVRLIHPHVSRLYPDMDVVYVMTMLRGLTGFAYPRGLHMADYPYVGEPRWMVRAEAEFGAVAGMGHVMRHAPGSEEIQRLRTDPFEVVRNASRILFAGDPCRTEVVNFDNILSHVFKDDARRDETCDLVVIRGLTTQSLEESFSDLRTTDDPWFVETLGGGRLRRTFDYCHDVNSMALFDRELVAVIPTAPRGQISKITLQILYHLRDVGETTESRILHDMCEWKGTGRYSDAALGSATSRGEVTYRLHAMGLATPTDEPRRTIRISDAGRELLNRLHPDCRDPDQIGRLNAWEANWQHSKPKMERYLRTFFGKQKRFAARS